MVNNGQSTLVSSMRGRTSRRDPAAHTAAGFDPSPARSTRLQFGFQSAPVGRSRMIDATIKCDIDQVEKMISVMLDVPTQASPGSGPRSSAADHALPFSRAIPLPIEQVLVVGWHGGAADSDRRRALVPGVPCQSATRRPGPICWCSSTARASRRPSRHGARRPFRVRRSASQELSRHISLHWASPAACRPVFAPRKRIAQADAFFSTIAQPGKRGGLRPWPRGQWSTKAVLDGTIPSNDHRNPYWPSVSLVHGALRIVCKGGTMMIAGQVAARQWRSGFCCSYC